MEIRRLQWIVFSVYAMIFTFSLCHVHAEATRYWKSSEPFQYAVAEDGIWLNQNDTILWHQDSFFEPEEITRGEQITHIAASGNILYYVTENGSRQLLSSVYSNGTMDISGVLLQLPVHQLEAFEDGRLIALTEEGALYSVYDRDGSMMTLDIPGWENAHVTAFSVWNRAILAYKADSGELSLLSDDRQILFSSVTIPNLTWVQIGDYDENSGWVVALSDGKLLKIDLKNGNREEIAVSLPSDAAGLRRNKTAIFTLCHDFTQLHFIPVSAIDGHTNGKILTIVNSVGGHARRESAVKLFHRQYPDVEVVERRIDDPRIIATELMAGSEGIDLVGLQDSYMPVSAAFLLRSGAIADLNQVDALVAAREPYRDIFGMVTIGDKWYAVPETVTMHMWQVNPGLARQIGWEIPDGRWTQAEFRSLAEKVATYNRTAEKPIYLLQDDTFLLPWFLYDYQVNHVDFASMSADYMTDDYVEILNFWKELNDQGLICKAVNMINPTMRPNTLLAAGRYDLWELRNSVCILPPQQNPDAPFPVYGGVLALNAHSPNRAEAEFFLECYLSLEAVSHVDRVFEGQWLTDSSIYDEQDDWYSLDERTAALWDEMLIHSIPELFVYDIQRDQYDTLLPALLSGEIDASRFAAVSQRLADMAFGE
ncbi:MAG: hypothetical protein IJ083_10570 [Clostridia bacterium]|nr:hypothetical protein [Clostridia bacterium]